MNDPDIERAVRRRVGIATLRRLHRLIDAERQREAVEARWALRLGVVFAVLIALTLAWMGFR